MTYSSERIEWHKDAVEKARRRDLEKWKALGIERVEVLSANDEAACEPCRRRDGGKFVIRASMPNPTAAVCESGWCRCAHLAVLDLAWI